MVKEKWDEILEFLAQNVTHSRYGEISEKMMHLAKVLQRTSFTEYLVPARSIFTLILQSEESELYMYIDWDPSKSSYIVYRLHDDKPTNELFLSTVYEVVQEAKNTFV